MSSAVATPVMPGLSGAPARVPVGGVLTPRMERLIRVISVGSALVIAISAMVLSYSGLHDLALDAQISPQLALLVPVMVDGLQFVGSLGVVYSTLSGLRSWYPWTLMLMGVSISAWGNWQAAPDDLTAKLLHAAAPIILALVLEELLRVMRHKVQAHTLAYEAAQDAADAEAAETTDSPEPTGGAVLVEAELSREVPATTEIPSPAHVEPLTASTSPTPDLSAPDFAPTDPHRVNEGQGVNPDRLAHGETEIVAETSSKPDVTPAQQPTWEPREQVVPLSTLRSQQAAPTEERPATQTTAQAPAPVMAAVDSDDAEADAEGPVGDSSLPPYPEDAPLKEQVRAILSAQPDIRPIEIVRGLGKDASYTRKVVREVRAELDTDTAHAEPVEAETAKPVAEVAQPDAFAASTEPAVVEPSVVEPALFAAVSEPAPTPTAAAEPTVEPLAETLVEPLMEPVTTQPASQALAAEVDADDPFASPMYASR